MTFVRLSKAAEINPPGPKGAQLNGKDCFDFVPMAAVRQDGYIDEVQQRPYAEVAKGYTTFKDNDILVAKITPCFENNKIALARTRTEFAFGSTEFHVIRCKPGKLEPKYLLHLLRADPVRHEGERRMTGSAGQKRVPKSFFEELELPIPDDIDEQRRIAAILDKADAIRRKRQQALALADDLLKSAFLEMFAAKEWPTKPLSKVVAEGTIVTYGIVQAGPEYPGGVPYIRTGDIKEGRILAEGLRHTSPEIASKFSRSTVRSGEIVMSIRATVGTTAVVPDELDGANLTQGTARISPGSEVTPEYLLYFLRSSACQNWLEKQVKGATFREITLARLRELEVPLPPPRLQRTFSELCRKVRENQRKLALDFRAANELSSVLSQRAFRGEL